MGWFLALALCCLFGESFSAVPDLYFALAYVSLQCFRLCLRLYNEAQDEQEREGREEAARE